MKSSILALQGAIYDRLTNNAPLMNKVTGVFDDVPDGQAMPYVAIGNDTGTPFLTFNRNGEELTNTLHIWSDYQGMAEVKEIMNLVLQAMTDTPLVVNGFHVVDTRLDMMTDSVEADGTARQGILRFRFVIQEAV